MATTELCINFDLTALEETTDEILELYRRHSYKLPAFVKERLFRVFDKTKQLSGVVDIRFDLRRANVTPIEPGPRLLEILVDLRRIENAK